MKSPSRHNILLLPAFGFCLYVLLYLVAVFQYPGGSEVDRSSVGFNWMQNYWCDLLAHNAENGLPNTARTIAITAMAVLCLSIALYSYFVPRLLDLPKWTKIVISVSGILSMGVLSFLQSGNHDTVINASVALGLLSMLLTLWGMFHLRLWGFIFSGILCLLLALLNTYVYYSKTWIGALPVIQKISFLSFLLWFSLVSIKVYTHQKGR